MKLITSIALLTLLSIPVVGYSAPVLHAYTSASKAEKLVICVPFLTKKAGVLDLAAKRMAESGDSAALRNLRDMAFNIEYRGATLNALVQPHNRTLLNQSWRMSADHANRSAYDRLIEQCVDLYNDEWHAGRIPKDLEAKEAAKITASQANWPNTKRSNIPADTKRPDIPSGCNSLMKRDFDICTAGQLYASIVADKLPHKINEDLTLVTVTASQRKVTLTAILAYDHAKFVELTGGDQEVIQKVNASVTTRSRSSVCAQPQAKSFISNGGQVDYLYQFSDRTTYLKSEVRYCP